MKRRERIVNVILHSFTDCRLMLEVKKRSSEKYGSILYGLTIERKKEIKTSSSFPKIVNSRPIDYNEMLFENKDEINED